MKKLHLPCVLVLLAWGLVFDRSTIALADGPSDNQGETVRAIPPEGIEIPEELRTGITEELKTLQEQLDSLRKNGSPRVQALLPDVEIFEHAVASALEHGEFFEARDFKSALALVREGQARAASLENGEAPWTTQTGLVVRGYRSRLDGTAQPYGLVIPETYEHNDLARHRCDLWCHGRGEKLLELQFIHGRMNQVGEISPADTIVLHPYGRYCNANKLAGEVDTLEALAHAQSQYRIDEDRIAIRGFSMGGAAAWHLAVHYPSKWFAANPGAGFSETPDFLRVFQNEELTPEPYEEALWRMYDCPLWAMNLTGCPTVAYSGEIDKQKQAADIMEKACQGLGLDLVHIIGPGTAHSIHPASKIEIERRLAALAKVGRRRTPRTLSFVTYTLKYNQMHWLTVNGLGEHWQPALVQAYVNPEWSGIHLTVNNVTDLTLHLDPDQIAEPGQFRPEIRIAAADGSESKLVEGATRPVRSDQSWTVRLQLVDGVWKGAPVSGSPATASPELRKQHNLQGPIDDAFMDSFLFVTPSFKCRHEAVETWVQSELKHATDEWRRQMRGKVRTRLDTDLTAADIATHNLVLWGDPGANTVLAKMLDKLPLQWTETELTLGSQKLDATTHAPILIYPNPLNPKKYVVLNSGFTYREYDYLNNARQVPKLPDWAVIDLTTPPNPRWPGKVAAAGWFDEKWKLK